MVCLSVGHIGEPCKNSWGAFWDGDLEGPNDPGIRCRPDPPRGRGNFVGVLGHACNQHMPSQQSDVAISIVATC